MHSEAATEPSSDDVLRSHSQALLSSSEWETIAAFTGTFDAANGSVQLSPAKGVDLSHLLDPRPMNDWISTLGGDPGAVYIKVNNVGVGPTACSLPVATPYDAPGVGCVDLQVVNQTGLDASTMLIELFPVKEHPLLSYGPVLSAEVDPASVVGDLVHDPENEPGPLWVVSDQQATTITLEVGTGTTVFGVRVMAQREVCDNGQDDDNDGKVDEGCRSLPTGAACSVEIDCASAICAAGICVDASAAWVTVGVFEIDWALASASGEMQLESLSPDAWSANLVAAPPKATASLVLELSDVELSPTACGVSDLAPYDERGVHCATFQAAGLPQLGSAPLVIEWLTPEGAPYERPLQSAFAFDEVPAAATGTVPIAGASFPIGSLIVERLDGRNESMAVRPLVSAHATSLVRVATPVGVLQPPPTPPQAVSNIPPGADVVFPSRCLDSAPVRSVADLLSGGEVVSSNTYHDPAVYGVLGDFDRILQEIGWTAEYLSSQFIADAYNERGPFQYMIDSFGEARLREVFKIPTTFDFSELHARPGKYANYFASEKALPGWIELLRPDPTGRRDSFWGLRALGEHGALGTQSVRMRVRGGTRITLPGMIAMTGCEFEGGTSECVEPIYETVGGGSEIPQPRQYVLPQGNYVVRTMQTGTIPTPYHGPMPGYCEAAQYPAPELRDGSPLHRGGQEYALTEVTPPSMRWGVPGLTWYGWENVELDACGAEIRFEVDPDAIDRLVPPEGRPPAADRTDGWLPMCLRSARQDAEDDGLVHLGISFALKPNNLTIMGSTDVTIRNLQLRGAIETLDFDLRTRDRSDASVDWWLEGRGLRPWSNFDGAPALPDGNDGPWVRSPIIPAQSLDVHCASSSEVGVLPSSPYRLSAAVATPHTLVTSDNIRLRLDGVHASRGFDAAILGENGDSPRCPGPDNIMAREPAQATWGPDANGVYGLRTAATPDQSDKPAMYEVPSIDIHDFAPENNVGRFPTERMSTPGLCDAFNCMDLELLVRNSSFEEAGRNSLTVGHVRQAVFDHVRVAGGGSAHAHPMMVGAPRAGADFEGGDTRSNVLVEVERDGDTTTAAVLKAGQYNIIDSLFEDNAGSAAALYNNWGRYEEVRFIDTTFHSPESNPADGEGPKALIHAPNTGVDFVGCTFDSRAQRKFTIWARGGSGLFHNNTVRSISDVVLGEQPASCGATWSGDAALAFQTAAPASCVMPEFPPVPDAIGVERRWNRPAQCSPEDSDNGWVACPATFTAGETLESVCCGDASGCEAIACEDSCCIVRQTPELRELDETAWHELLARQWVRARAHAPWAETAVAIRENAEALQSQCVDEYDGASPYPRCRDALLCAAMPRSTLVDIGDGRTIPVGSAQSTVVRAGTDIPWSDDLRDQLVRSVSGNSITITPTEWAGQWQGASVDLNAELVDGNSVCVTDGTASPLTPTVTLGAPFMPRQLRDNDFARGQLAQLNCESPVVVMPSVSDAEWGEGITEPGSIAAEAWMACECAGSSSCPTRFAGFEFWDLPPAGCRYALGTDGSVRDSLRCGDDRGPVLNPDYLDLDADEEDQLCWTDAEAIAFRQPDGGALEDHPVQNAARVRAEAVESVRNHDLHWYFPPDRYSRVANTPPSDSVVALSDLSAIRLDAFPGADVALTPPDCAECANPGDLNCYVWPEEIARPEEP